MEGVFGLRAWQGPAQLADDRVDHLQPASRRFMLVSCPARIESAGYLLSGRYLPNMDVVPPRKPGTLLPLEAEILTTALSMHRAGQATFHGFGLAHAMREQQGSRALTAHGTLYKALGRLEELGLLTSSWEDVPATESRPRRRLYGLTGPGIQAADRAHADQAARRLPRLAPGPA
jgi:PadR family transcriptional regulator, regulatory protein PadR